jgi:hypothetical protein
VRIEQSQSGTALPCTSQLKKPQPTSVFSVTFRFPIHSTHILATDSLKMATKDGDKATQPPVDDTRDALEVLESEAKEWEKDAEINRILNAFRLDA